MVLTLGILRKPFAAAWHFIMGDKPEVLRVIQRDDPALKLNGRDGFSYTVRLTNETEREVFIDHRVEDDGYDYSFAYFVDPIYAGDNFYSKGAQENRLTLEPVPKSVIEAMKAFDNAQNAAWELSQKKTIESPVRPEGAICVSGSTGIVCH